MCSELLTKLAVHSFHIDLSSISKYKKRKASFTIRLCKVANLAKYSKGLKIIMAIKLKKAT